MEPLTVAGVETMARKTKTTAAKKQSTKATRARATDDVKITPIGANPFTPGSARHGQLERRRGLARWPSSSAKAATAIMRIG
jgi:hypothetical protein